MPVLSFILRNPVLFNSIRKIIAGDQNNTKDFVKFNLLKSKAKTVIDIGCGTGDFVTCLPDKVSYLGIDINRNFISFAQSHYSGDNIKFALQDVTQKEFYKNKKFEAVLFISMLHHLTDDELNIVLPIIKKLTKKVIIFADIIPNPKGILRKIIVKLDQGKYVREKELKIKLLKKYFKITETKEIPSRLAVQYGIVCRP